MLLTPTLLGARPICVSKLMLHGLIKLLSDKQPANPFNLNTEQLFNKVHAVPTIQMVLTTMVQSLSGLPNDKVTPLYEDAYVMISAKI